MSNTIIVTSNNFRAHATTQQTRIYTFTLFAHTFQKLANSLDNAPYLSTSLGQVAVIDYFSSIIVVGGGIIVVCCMVCMGWLLR